MNPTLAITYNPARHDVSGWLLSEKLDGVRAIWDGNRFLSRNGRPFDAPPDWLSAMPAGIVLDGELWAGRGQMQRAAGIVRSRGGSWDGLTYRVFDAPGAPGGFSARLDSARDAVRNSPVCVLVEHETVSDPIDVESALDAVLDAGGEGVILRDPAAGYTDGRTDAVLKYKRTSTDEATVESVDGRVITCDWCGVKVRLTSGPDAPAVGSAVTFAYSGVTPAGQPRNAALVGVRDYE